MQIEVVPSLSDNYIHILHADDSRVLMVDPGDADAACAAVVDKTLAAVLITHRHADHIGGLSAVCAAHPQAAVYAPAGCGIAAAQVCTDGETLDLLDGQVRLRVVATPGHTLEHIAYVGDGFVFSGDTLFIGGCGRVFEGTMEQMYTSLAALAQLPDETMIYCGHEYTLANLNFAAAVEPDNTAIRARLHAVKQLRAAGKPSVPDMLVTERATNPFLRTGEVAVRRAAQEHSGEALPTAAAVFSALRKWKDDF